MVELELGGGRLKKELVGFATVIEQEKALESV